MTADATTGAITPEASGHATWLWRQPLPRTRCGGVGVLRGVVVPLAVAQLVVHLGSAHLGAVPWKADLFVTLVAVCTIPGPRGIRGLPALAFGAWALGSLPHVDAEAFPTELVVAAVLTAVALRAQHVSRGGAGDDTARPWYDSAAGIGAGCVLGALVCQALGQTTTAAVVLGFGLGVVVLGAALPDATRPVGFAGVGFVALAGVATAGARVGLYPVGLRPVLAGIVFGVVVLGVAARVRWAPLLLPLVVAAAAWCLALPGSLYVVVLGPAAAVAMDLAPSATPSSLRARRLALAWVVVGVSAGLQVSTINGRLLVALVPLAGALLLVAPLPDRWLTVARVPRLLAWGSALAAGVSAGVDAAIAFAQVAFDVAVRPPARWFATPTSTMEVAAAEPSSRLGRLLDSWALPVVGWWVLAVAIQLRASGLAAVGTGRGGPSLWFVLRHPFDATGRIGWGTGDYWAVADHGYRLSEHREAVFPVVALLVRWTSSAFHIGLVSAQVAVASASGLAASVLFFALMGRLGIRGRVRVVAQLLFLVFPWNFVSYGYGYSDPTLLALVLAAFTAAELGLPVVAGLVGAVATATRPNSLPIIPALVAFELRRSGAVARTGLDTGDAPWWWPDRRFSLHLDRLQPAQWTVVVSAAGVVAYSWWLWGHAGDPLYWLHDQSYYGHGSVLSPVTWFKSSFLLESGHVVTNPLWAVNEVLTAVVVVAAVALTPTVWRRFGAAYGVFVAGIVAIAWVAPRGFAPGARYLLPALPFFAIVAAEWLSIRRRVLIPLVATFTAAGFLAVTAFIASEGTWLEW